MDRNLLLPAALGGILILSLCFVEQVYLRDYWSKPGAEAELMGKRFENVPKEIGDWTGQNLSVDEIVKNTAGAVNYVSRLYKNTETGQEVRLWLIVGHSRDICRHTPNICYPNAGFRQEGQQIRHEVKMPKGESPAKFFTGKFIKEDGLGRHAERVFWAWNHPDVGKFEKKWEAPEDPRKHYGLSRALYKVYFTSSVLADEDTAADNVANEFAELALPEINKALFPESTTAAEGEPTDTAEPAADANGAEAAASEDTNAAESETTPAETAAE
jgi:hypothetical protein